MDSTPVSRRASMLAPMQAILDRVSMYPPPVSSLTSSPSGGSGVQLMAVSNLLDLVILCERNVLRATNLLDAYDENNRSRGEMEREGALSKVTFTAGGSAPIDGNEMVPSDSIPANMQIKGLEFSPSSSELLVWGEDYIAVAQLPNSSRTNASKLATPSPMRSTAGAASRLLIEDNNDARKKHVDKWKWTLVDMSEYAVDVKRHKIIKACWHPASPNCVTLLTTTRDEGRGLATASVMLHVPGRLEPEKGCMIALVSNVEAAQAETIPRKDTRICSSTSILHDSAVFQVFSIPDGPSESPVVDVAYGTGMGWQRFALWIARRDGTLAAMCPVMPPTTNIAKEEVLSMWNATNDMLVAARWERSTKDFELKAERDALDEEVAHLEQQQMLLRRNFKAIVGHEDLDGQSTVSQTNARGGDSQDQLPSVICPVLQDNIIDGSRAPGSNGGSNLNSGYYRAETNRASCKRREEDVGPVCGLVVLQRDPQDTDPLEEENFSDGNLTVLALAYRAGWLDLVVVPSGVEPRWLGRKGVRITPSPGSSMPPAAAVLESLDLAERLPDSIATRKQSLTLAVGTGPWTLIATTPSRMSAISVSWASEVQVVASKARNRAGDSEITRLDADLRATLRGRGDSLVAEVLFVPPSSQAGRIVSITPIGSAHFGHLVMARLSKGVMELANVGVITHQAIEMASAAKRASEQNTSPAVNMLPPFTPMVEKFKKAVEGRQWNKPLRAGDGTRSSVYLKNAQEADVAILGKESDRLCAWSSTVLQEIINKTQNRLGVMSDIYEQQGTQIGKLSKSVNLLRFGLQDAEKCLERISKLGRDQRERSSSILAVLQVSLCSASVAERAFLAEMKDIQGYADRREAMMEPATVQVAELRAAEKEVEDSLVRDAEGEGAGGGLSEQETQDIWNMLHADRARIMELNQRLEVAKTRLGEFRDRTEN